MSELTAKELYIRQISIHGDIPADNYVAHIPVVRHLMCNTLELHKPVTIFVGENGIGKSTLIEALAVTMRFNAEGGTKNFNFATHESHSSLHEYLHVIKGSKQTKDGFFLRAESFYNVATELEGDLKEELRHYGGKSLHEQSHGESFIALMENRFWGKGLYILDEPEAALSPMRLMRMMYIMHDLIQRDSQFIISTQSPILMTCPDAEVMEITDEGIRSVNYKDTEHYIVTKRFMDAPEKIVESLLGDG